MKKRNVKVTYYELRKIIKDVIGLITTIFAHPISNMNVV